MFCLVHVDPASSDIRTEPPFPNSKNLDGERIIASL
jgi:hypothetical protein